MIHHYKRLYKSAYVPKPLTFAVRRPAHAPEGVLAIVDDKDQPVQMLGRQVVRVRVRVRVRARVRVRVRVRVRAREGAARADARPAGG